MLGQNIHQEGVEVLGDMDKFVAYCAIWRRVLELSWRALHGEFREDEPPTPPLHDPIVGRYIIVSPLGWGSTKIFYEQSGDGNNPHMLFLHTAGSDSRQYHGVMTDPRMLAKCHMTAFDLPGHGRSFPSEKQIPGAHTNSEDVYVDCIGQVIKALGLKKPIVCGASMGGHVCLALALRTAEVGVGGVIPCQACEFTDMKRQWWDRSLLVNQSLFNPEWTYGMMAPNAPRINRDLVWHTYSSQAFGLFHGDLDFYFGGWDGRERVCKIDTKKCPVYLLTGEYDWSTTPELTEKTAAKIPGAKYKKMLGLGHFPATENPTRFVPYLIEAINHILSSTEMDSATFSPRDFNNTSTPV
ncbi:alpha/beta hydrolase fold family protein [Metarhizium album ARSEF 1941]|uniref:Alpha/beta hydrolase fold family protein n=1 Tax=Metarhizium album (strain ARSEF 1941) TaxID=1081103 RepID=A0A0B2WY59_METAS|nr:alpha/beta hydrolase fold family protein [Metarhizium album ARSEF 1941]KHN98347.1 alpha/beta hydrolase fold family protein [Metarhizium album ARSEF 1941]